MPTAVDVRTAAGQKLNPPSLFFFSSFLYLSLLVFIYKFELRQCQPGKPKESGPLKIPTWSMDGIAEVMIQRDESLVFVF